MKYLLLLLISLSFSISSTDVGGAGFDKLSEVQKAEMLKLIAIRANAVDSTASPAATASQWVDIGIRLGQAISSCARELGMAIDAFLGTTTGKLTFMLIAWKVMASDIIHVGGAIIFLIIGALLFRYFHISFSAKTIEYDTSVRTLWWHPVKSVKRNDLSMEQCWALFCIAAVFVAAAAISIYNI